MICSATVDGRTLFFVSSEYFEPMSPGFETVKEALEVERLLESKNCFTMPSGEDIEDFLGVGRWNVDRCNEELGAAGHYSCFREYDIIEARAAVIAMKSEMVGNIVKVANIQSARETAEIFSQGTPFTSRQLFDAWCDACDDACQNLKPEDVYEKVLRAHPEFHVDWLS